MPAAFCFCWAYLISGAWSHIARSRQSADASRIATVVAAATAHSSAGLSKATQKPVDAEVFNEFTAWTGKYLAAATPDAREALLEAGLRLARKRRTVLARLIVTDPKRALELAVPVRAREQLPASVVEHLEERISARGEYAVLVFDSFDSQTGVRRSRISRNVEINGQAYRAKVYGRRLGVTTKSRMAFHGIALDRYLAMHESPVRVLEEGERLNPAAPLGNPDKRCPICMADAAGGTVADVGGLFYFFDSAEDLKTFTERIEAQEDIIDPAASGLDNLPAIR